MTDTQQTTDTAEDGASSTLPNNDGDSSNLSNNDGDSLNEGGKKALEAERRARREADKRTKALESKLAEIEAANMTETEKAIAEAKAAGVMEATQAMQSRLFAAEVRAAATGKLVDLDLVGDEFMALKILGLGAIPTAEDGQIDTAAITVAIDALVEAKPHLAANSGGAKRPSGTPDGGPRGSAPADLATTDMDTYRRIRRGQN